MKETKEWLLPVGITLTVCAALLCLAAALCCKPAIEGTRMRDGDVYALDMQMMTGTDRHTLELEAGDVLQIRFETVKGSLRLEIEAPNGATLYRGNGTAVRDFSLEAQETGVYQVLIEASRAQGNVSIQVQKLQSRKPGTI